MSDDERPTKKKDRHRKRPKSEQKSKRRKHRANHKAKAARLDEKRRVERAKRKAGEAAELGQETDAGASVDDGAKVSALASPNTPDVETDETEGEGPRFDFAPSGARRALVAHDVATRVRGDRTVGAALEEAWAEAQQDPDEWTHGFHSYPARMHPRLARRCLALRGGAVLDPFCGSGTVLVEARAAGRAAAGTDLNPLAVRLAATKSALRDEASLERFGQLLRHVAERSEERVRERVPVVAPIPSEELRWYAPHILKELAGLREEIAAVADETERHHLEMVLSAIIVKFSLQRADTSKRIVDKTLRKGLPTEFFLRRGRELIGRWRSLREAAAPGPEPLIRLGDARELTTTLPKRASADLLLTSPPYGGTYDYVDHHARRYPWLGLKARRLGRMEIGARRHSRERGALERWNQECADMLRSMRARCRKDALAVLLMGDGFVEDRLVPADEQLEALGPAAGFSLVAVASQSRPDWHGSAMRQEHLVALAAV